MARRIGERWGNWKKRALPGEVEERQEVTSSDETGEGDGGHPSKTAANYKEARYSVYEVKPQYGVLRTR
jgi:hypothetical protein